MEPTARITHVMSVHDDTLPGSSAVSSKLGEHRGKVKQNEPQIVQSTHIRVEHK
jgi:hypothetical protein